MSTHIAEVVRYTLEKHPNASFLSIAQVKGWNCVVRTSDFETEHPIYKDLNLGVYIPIEMVAPKDHPLLGFLEGKRTRTIKLRGEVSQGILLPLQLVVETYLFKKLPEEGDDLTQILGVKRWEEPEMSAPIHIGPTPKKPEQEWPEWLCKYTDIENFNNYPNIFKEGDKVQISEKLHGCCSLFALIDDKFYICSHYKCLRAEPLIVYKPKFKNRCLNKLLYKLNLLKYLSTKGVVAPENSVWHRIAIQYDIEDKLRKLAELLGVTKLAVYGEVIGVQKGFLYGLNPGEVDFYAFDMRVGGLENDGFISPHCASFYISEMGLKQVPILKEGPFELKDLDLRFGNNTISNTHIREGIIIKPLTPSYDRRLGRVILKKVSEDYLMNKK